MTKASILIEKNIPMPETWSGQAQKYPFEGMKVGDSFNAGKYERKKMQSIYGSIYFFIKKKGNKNKKFSIRRTTEGEMRIWRKA